MVIRERSHTSLYLVRNCIQGLRSYSKKARRLQGRNNRRFICGRLWVTRSKPQSCGRHGPLCEGRYLCDELVDDHVGGSARPRHSGAANESWSEFRTSNCWSVAWREIKIPGTLEQINASVVRMCPFFLTLFFFCSILLSAFR